MHASLRARNLTNKAPAKGDQPASDSFQSRLDAASFRRSATVVGDRRNVANHRHLEAGGLESAQSGFTPRPGTFGEDGDALHAVIHRFVSGIIGGDLGCERRGFTRTAETLRTTCAPRNRATIVIGNRNNRVIERRTDVSHTARDILFNVFFRHTFRRFRCFSHCFSSSDLK